MIILLLLSDAADAAAAAASMALPFARSQSQLNSLDWIVPHFSCGYKNDLENK